MKCGTCFFLHGMPMLFSYTFSANSFSVYWRESASNVLTLNRPDRGKIYSTQTKQKVLCINIIRHTNNRLQKFKLWSSDNYQTIIENVSGKFVKLVDQSGIYHIIPS